MRSRRRADSETRWRGRLVAVVIALGLLSVPVECLCGAQYPAPHSLFGLSAVAGDAGDMAAQDDGMGAMAMADGGRAMAERAGPPASAPRQAARPRVPGFSYVDEVISPAERAAAFAVAILGLAVFLAARRPRVLPRLDVAWVGLRPSPEPPPPRLAAARG